jgi:hypothetical protein
MPKLEEQAEEIEAKDERIAELEATVDSLESRLESVIDVDDKADSTPTNRAVALREALVRAASDRLNGSGVKWWWKEVEEHLATHGHGGFSKPTYHKAMADAADKDGFTETTKEVISGGQRREVKAIQVDASEVTDPHLRNQLTTRDAGSASSETATAED